MNGYKSWKLLVFGALFLASGTNLALADMSDVETAERIAGEVSASLGYRGVSSDDNAGRAREYDSLESSPLFKLNLFSDQGPYHIGLGVDYLNEDDFSANANLDYSGLLRLDLRTQRFFHNLDHIPYNNGVTGGEIYPPPAPPGIPWPRSQTGTPGEGSRPDALSNNGYRAYYSDQNPGDDYGLRLDMSEAKLRVKCPDYPAHFNLSYWRYEKQGEKQLRFVGENCTTACHMQSKTRKIDRITEEVKASLDAHAGFVDVVLESLFRTFRDRQSVPVDAFGSHSNPGLRSAGNYEHDEDPDSKLKEFTIKLNTAPSGGLVGSASFSIGERENRSDLNSVAPVEAETDYYRASADGTYTPSQNWAFNLRYRLLDMDSDNTAVIYDNVAAIDAFKSPLAVRSSMDITRAWYEATATYRPTSSLTLKAEFRREDIDRSDTGDPVTHNASPTPITINPNWELPEEEIITRMKLGFSSRLLEKSALKLSGWLAIQHNDDPAYGTSYGDSQELFLATSYTPSPFWGMMANVNLLQQENDEHELHDYELDREKKQQNISLGTWVNPREGLSFDLNYGYFHTNIDQDLLFGTSSATFVPGLGVSNYIIPNDSVDYRQTVHTVTAGMTWQALETLSCRVEGYHIRSKADFEPDFGEQGPFLYNIYGARYNGTASSADLKEISKVDIRQNGLRGRVDWQIDENWSCGVEATYDNYDEIGNDIYDGSVQTCMVSFSRGW